MFSKAVVRSLLNVLIKRNSYTTLLRFRLQIWFLKCTWPANAGGGGGFGDFACVVFTMLWSSWLAE